ncbi:alpha/beta fold hydrolase [Micromonospora mirobrigensis]|uniref:Alpha/beta hydrolase family protein n=1 Tax=Micromonospora mirobrigensis TaxID=262898 RepID=A0A1C5AHR9_9ACTN|nr:alpha/beta fold hydrolase [Micromonospora mirobrigensis]SCF44656.1 Alpha/beta hydrolase family protein [Micromonospora mirobrigensis]
MDPDAAPLERPTMLLVHSPLLTPASWDALLPYLTAAGWRVVVPDLRPLVEAPSFHAAVRAAAVAGVAPGAPTVVVGHSRAGAYLPGIVDAVGGRDVVFLDARLPHPGASWLGSSPPERAAWLRERSTSGRLPRWDTWFPADSMAELLPDPGQRRHVLADLPELPWQVVAEILPPAGAGWESARRGYLRLSRGYEPTAAEAEGSGYRVRRVETDHLAMVSRPELVAELILSTVGAGAR